MPETIERSKLQNKIENDASFVLLETLPEESYNSGHLPGAHHLGPDDLENLDALSDRVEQLIPDRDTDIVVYCANAGCSASNRTAKKLEKLGFENVFDYHEGKEDWRAAGLPIESS